MEVEYVAQNRAELERLKALVGRLSSADFDREIAPGWTIRMALAHLAYWDEYAVLAHARWQRQGFVPIASGETDLINDAALPLFRHLPWAALRDEVVRAAEEVDQVVAAVSPDLAQQIVSGGRERLLNRHVHRRMHLDDIERTLGY